MPTTKRQEKHVLLQVTTGKEIDPEVAEAVRRFNKYASGFRNKGKALQSLLSKAKVF